MGLQNNDTTFRRTNLTKQTATSLLHTIFRAHTRLYDSFGEFLMFRNIHQKTNQFISLYHNPQLLRQHDYKIIAANHIF
jgi:hypothetical protein